MNRLLMWLLLSASVTAFAQQAEPALPADAAIMLAAVSRNDSVLIGGISSGNILKAGTVSVEPMAWLTPSGEWRKIDCIADDQKGCNEFQKTYLSKPHTYTVVSADGRGATVKAAPTTLSECSNYTGKGTYSGAPIRDTAIAASSTEMFTTGPSAKRIAGQDAEPILKALSAFIPVTLDSVNDLRLYSLHLESQDVIVVQRAYQNYSSKPGYDPQKDNLKLFFSIGTMSEGIFRPVEWNLDDGNELVLGTIHLKNGRDFLVTSVNDSESQIFRIYGIKNGRLALVFLDGGSSC
jgi:hypothetical protein